MRTHPIAARARFDIKKRHSPCRFFDFTTVVRSSQALWLARSSRHSVRAGRARRARPAAARRCGHTGYCSDAQRDRARDAQATNKTACRGSACTASPRSSSARRGTCTQATDASNLQKAARITETRGPDAGTVTGTDPACHLHGRFALKPLICLLCKCWRSHGKSGNKRQSRSNKFLHGKISFLPSPIVGKFTP
ncbi:hypothetical protein ABIE58_002018 [Roseovarius sp. MBR-78]